MAAQNQQLPYVSYYYYIVDNNGGFITKNNKTKFMLPEAIDVTEDMIESVGEEFFLANYTILNAIEVRPVIKSKNVCVERFST